MIDINENKTLENNEKINEIPNYPSNLSLKRESLMVQKSREFLRRKKAISLRHIHDDNKKINININHNININTNLKKDEYSNINFLRSDTKSKIKMKSCIMGMENENKSNEKNKKFNTVLKNKNIRENLNNINNISNERNKSSMSKDRSREIESSFKMDKLLDNQTKSETRESKQEQFIEFYINDNNSNKIYKLKDNTITTTKYNIFTFIPKGLLYQFSRASNVYFLFTAIIQSIPIISPLTSLTAIVPLIFVLGVSMIREAIEDLVRNNYDNLNNEEEVIVFRNNRFVKSTSKSLKHGEIVLVYENHNIPADMILIDTGFGEGTCYVETSSLDGEKTLKLKVANKYTQGFISNDIDSNKGIEKIIQPKKYSLKGFIRINSPNSNLNYINGTFHPKFKKHYSFIEQDINICTNELLLKGSVLKNTNWIIGIVVYTGMNNKIILNSKKPRLKMSKIEKKLNLYLLFVFCFLILCCGECSMFHHFHYKTNKKFYENFIFISNDVKTESFIIFFTYFLLLNTLIPISLIVSTEIIKMIQGIFIKWDIYLYSKWRHCFCTAKSVSIIEELGNVNFIFSDKTGTLTKNQLQFKYCIIDTKYFEYLKIGGNRKETSKNFIIRKSKRQNSMNTYEIISRQNKFNRKKNSFLSDNNKILLQKVNDSYMMNEDYYQLKKNRKSKTNRINISITYQESSGKNLNIINDKSKIFKNRSFYSKSINQSNNNLSKVSFSAHKNNTNSNRVSSSNSNSNINTNSKINQNITILSNTSNYKQDDMLRRDKNYTIIEARNEDNETSFNAIKIGEGYFSMAENNPFLKYHLSYKNINRNNSINYVHEFWTALALTNECMVKYEKGEIKYIGSSPDDLELVKAASLQGYKLIETTIDTKTIKISEKNFSFEILKVLGFSSERKRMSIIVKDKSGIKLYIKGADCEISKRLSKKSIKSDNYDIISNGLIEFSKKGLRTLMVAYRKINAEDYDSWVNRLHEDELNIENKQRLIDRLYDIIENNLTLIGGTVVEDKLQDNVPETIKELRAAGIKIWVLTGDKLDTAKNIGHSCNLLSEEQKLFTLKVMQDDEKIVKEDPFREMNEFFKEFQEFTNGLVKKYNLDSKYFNINRNINNTGSLNYNNIEIISDQSKSQSESMSNKSSSTSIINFEIFKCLKEKQILEPFSIIIEAPILYGLFKDEETTQNFLHIAYYSNTVICCRVSPSQKSEVIQKMKNFDKSAVTLAIGDGGNDVSMIMEANIGVGIHGEEGMSAAQASDFAIGEFQILKRLLFIHGRTNLYRISKMILYFFYKNFIFAITQFYFSFFCLASGQTFLDDWYITCYNLVFTALPLCIRAITDSDIDLNDRKNVKKNLALLYKENRDSYRIFTFNRLLWNLAKGIFNGFIVFINGYFYEILIKGYNLNIWYLSLNSYLSIIIVVSMNLLINCHFIIYLLPLSIGITTFLLLFIFLILNHYGIFFDFNSKATIGTSLSSLQLYLSIILISSFNFIFDYTSKLIRLYFNNSLSSKIILNNQVKKRKKSCSTNSKLNLSKIPNNKIVESLNNENEKSNNSLMPRDSYNKLNLINKNNRNYLNLNYVPKISRFQEGAYKNDFFSLQILKNINSNKSVNNLLSSQNKI